MTIANAFWIPALAITASALTTELDVAPASTLTEMYREQVFDDLTASIAFPSDFLPPDSLMHGIQIEPSVPDAAGTSDIWERLRAGFAITAQTDPAVAAHIETFRTHAWHFQQILKRSEPYLYYVLGRVQARGLPAELALLPVIESAFDPFARSPAGAVGIWQFMPSTAEHVGLQQDWWFDGRRDIVAATEAALDYLSALHDRYNGDWRLALGAYNAGGARISKAIRDNRSQGKPVDFQSLALPEETRNYVPKLLAVCAIIADPAAFRITLPALRNDHYFTSVETGGPLDLQVAAQLSDTPLDELQRLNPGLTRSVMPPGGSHRLLVPRAVAQRFRERLALLPDERRVQSVRYRIRPGDTLSEIAMNSRTTVAHLLKLNQLDSGSHIVAGRQLMVPVIVQEGDATDTVRESAANAPVESSA